MIRKGSLTNQRKFQTMRIQHSQDSKKFKTKKTQNSLSPFRKEIILHNKQNIHPNLLIKYEESNGIEQFINNKLNIHESVQENQSGGFKGLYRDKSDKGEKSRDPYYALKQQTLNKKIQNFSQKQKSDYETDVLENKKKQITNLIIDRPKNRSKQPEGGNNSLKKYSIISPKTEHKSKISPNPKKKIEKAVEKKKKNQHQPIFVKITNQHDLQKCQLEHTHYNSDRPLPIQQIPNATYLVTCKPASQIQFVCCEECVSKYANFPKNIYKIPLKEIASEQKYELQKYLESLYKQQGNLKRVKQGLDSCEKNYKKLCEYEYKKHKNHYNKLFEIIESAMNETQAILMKYTNEGYELLSNKMKQTQNKLSQITQQIQRITLLNRNFNNSKHPEITRQQINLNLIPLAKNCVIDSHIILPLFYIKSYEESALVDLQNLIKNKFAIEIYNEEENWKESVEVREEVEQKHVESIEYEQKRNSNGEKNIDFYCDEVLGESGVTSHNFSFELNEADQIKIKPNECILQLIEEEDVISPVFKAI